MRKNNIATHKELKSCFRVSSATMSTVLRRMENYMLLNFTKHSKTKKEFKDKQNTLYVAISLEAIKKTEVSKQGTTENGVAQNSHSVTISIPDMFAKINPKDINFLKYIPNEFLSEEQIEAK